MEEFYPQIRGVHIGTVIASGALFSLRALALNLFGATWTRAMPLRVASWTIDTALLAAALMLTTIVEQYPFLDGWLTVKVVLLVVYIGLGAVAMRPQRPRPVRLACLAAAFVVFAYIVTVARAHHPLGFLAGLTGAA